VTSDSQIIRQRLTAFRHELQLQADKVKLQAESGHLLLCLAVSQFETSM